MKLSRKRNKLEDVEEYTLRLMSMRKQRYVQEVLNVIVNHKSIIAHFPSLKLVDLWTILLLLLHEREWKTQKSFDTDLFDMKVMLCKVNTLCDLTKMNYVGDAKVDLRKSVCV